MSDIDILFDPEETEEEFLEKIRKKKYREQMKKDAEQDVAAAAALENMKEMLDRIVDDYMVAAKRQLEAETEKKKRDKTAKDVKNMGDVEKKERDIDNELDSQDIDDDDWGSWDSVD